MVADIGYLALDFETLLQSQKSRITFSAISLDIIVDIRLS